MTPDGRKRIETILASVGGKSGPAFVAALINDARAKNSPLHSEFEWDAKRAHPVYLKWRAQELIRQWYVTHVTEGEKTVRTRRIVSLAVVDEGGQRARTYQLMETVMRNDEMRDALLQQALRELAAFRRRYDDLVALRGVFEAIDEVTAADARRPAADQVQVSA